MFFDELFAKAQPLIVHSRGIQANLQGLSGYRAEYLPFCVYRELTSRSSGTSDTGRGPTSASPITGWSLQPSAQ